MNFDEFLDNPQKFILEFPDLGKVIENRIVTVKEGNEFIDGFIKSVDGNFVTFDSLDKNKNIRRKTLYSFNSKMAIVKFKNAEDNDFQRSFVLHFFLAGCMQINDALSTYMSIFENGEYKYLDLEKLRSVFEKYENLELLLPEYFLKYVIENNFIKYIPEETLLRIIKKFLLESNHSAPTLSQQWKEYKNLFLGLIKNNSNKEFWGEISVKLLEDKDVFEIAPINNKFEYLISNLESQDLSEIDVVELQKLILILKQSKNLTFWASIPINFLSFNELWVISPKKFKMEYIHSLLDSNKELSNNQIEKLKQFIKKSNILSIWNKIPTSFLSMNDFWDFAPAKKNMITCY